MYSICRVCGDEAKGHNYNEFTCASCKVFFHRYAAEPKKFQCRKIGNCEINIRTRKLCSFCRLNKCLSLGMKRKLIKIMINPSVTYANDSNNQNSQLLRILESKIAQQITNDPNYKPTLINVLPLEKCLNISNKLNELEWKLILDIRSAASVFGDECSAKITRKNTHLSDGFFVPEIYFQWIAAFCSKIDPFNCLARVEQIKVLKAFCFDVLCVRMGFNTDEEKDGFPMFLNYESNEAIFISLNFVRNTYKYDFMDRYIDYWPAMAKEMENDFIIRDLLSVQLLFKRQEKLSSPEFVRYYYTMYSLLLHKYLEIKYRNPASAKRKYDALMKLMDQIDQIKQYELVLFNNELECKNFNIPHIVVEMYDMT